MTPEEIACRKAEIRARLAGKQPTPEPENELPGGVSVLDTDRNLAVSGRARIDTRVPSVNKVSVNCPNCGAPVVWELPTKGAYTVNALEAECANCGAHITVDRDGARAG